MSKLIATVFGVGFMRPAPGTWGSLAALVLAAALFENASFTLFLTASVAAFVLGLYSVMAYTKNAQNPDPSEVVIDELAGQWIALWPVHYFGFFQFHSIGFTLILFGLSFALFRLFDVFKWGIIRRLDARKDALGVMLDDVAAGAFSALILLPLCIMAGV